jgi:hypothetical protein
MWTGTDAHADGMRGARLIHYCRRATAECSGVPRGTFRLAVPSKHASHRHNRRAIPVVQRGNARGHRRKILEAPWARVRCATEEGTADAQPIDQWYARRHGPGLVSVSSAHRSEESATAGAGRRIGSRLCAGQRHMDSIPRCCSELQLAGGFPIWSTGGTVLRSTENRPIATYRRSKRVDFVGFPRIGRTITSSAWRRIRMGTAGLEGVGCPSNLRSYRWGRKRSRRIDPVSRRKTQGCAPDD